MARPTGALNQDHAETRERLASAAFERLCAPDGIRVSFRELAQSAGVSVPTLKHYFEDREGVIAAALEHARKLGAPYLLMMTRPPDGPLRESVLGTMRFLAMGWPMGLDKCHAMGLAQGLEEPRLGPAYINEVLEPTTQAFEARLAHFAARGELKDCSLRVAALALVAPVLVALLHQGSLGGRACRPLDIDAFLVEHVERWADAYGAMPVASSP
ncbi:MAG: TetR/AcrR family transcriptional regulator [Myxococcales bacterium]|nr:TetR/AcrR family transcriptional regulator [Myxococcales bacterium]